MHPTPSGTPLRSWDVLPPTKGGRMGGRVPCGHICITCDEHDREYLSVPGSVARHMARKRSVGELCPQTREDLVILIAQASRQVAWDRMARLIARRDYSSGELRDRLLSEGFASDIVRSALERAQEVGLVSDARYADAFIRSKVQMGWGMSRIERELSRRGVDPSSCKGWPHEYLDPEDELQRAIDVASRKTVREPHAREKLARFLVGRGFSSGVAFDAAKRVLEQ